MFSGNINFSRRFFFANRLAALATGIEDATGRNIDQTGDSPWYRNQSITAAGDIREALDQS